VPEGDTILWAATRMRPVLEGHEVEVTHTHARFGKDRWEERLSGHVIERIDTHGKNLLLVFDNDYVIHSHLRMTGVWDVRPVGGRWRRSPRRAWLILRAGDKEVIEFDGPVLELMTGGRRRFDQRLALLGPYTRSIRRERSGMRCSTRRSSPASATSGSRSRAGRLSSTPSGNCER
jgi:endonuclease-8